MLHKLRSIVVGDRCAPNETMYCLVDMLNFHLDQDLIILESIPFCDDSHDKYNMNSVDAIIACLRSVNFWSFDGIQLRGIRKIFKRSTWVIHKSKIKLGGTSFDTRLLIKKPFGKRFDQNSRFVNGKHELWNIEGNVLKKSSQFDSESLQKLK